MKHIQLLSIVLITLLYSCTSTKDYYFPVEELTESKIYIYRCKENLKQTEYWKLTYNPKNNTLVTEAFHANFDQFEFFEEKLTDKGFQLEKFITHVAQDKTGKPGTIVRKPIEKDVYLWEMEKPYTYSASLMDETYGEVVFEKKRMFAGKETITIDAKVYETLKFTANCKTELVAKKERYTYNQITHYAKNIGMVRSEKQFEDGKNVVIELSKILSLEEWNQLKNK